MGGLIRYHHTQAHTRTRRIGQAAQRTACTAAGRVPQLGSAVSYVVGTHAVRCASLAPFSQQQQTQQKPSGSCQKVQQKEVPFQQVPVAIMGSSTQARSTCMHEAAFCVAASSACMCRCTCSTTSCALIDRSCECFCLGRLINNNNRPSGNECQITVMIRCI